MPPPLPGCPAVLRPSRLLPSSLSLPRHVLSSVLRVLGVRSCMMSMCKVARLRASPFCACWRLSALGMCTVASPGKVSLLALPSWSAYVSSSSAPTGPRAAIMVRNCTLLELPCLASSPVVATVRWMMALCGSCQGAVSRPQGRGCRQPKRASSTSSRPLS